MSRRAWVALVVLVALAVAWRVSYFRQARPLPGGGDAIEYDMIATTLLETATFRTPDHGLPHGEYAVRTPGYPVCLAALYWAGRQWFASRFALVRPVQLALDLCTLLLVFALARRLLGTRQAWLVALLYAAYPGFWWAASYAYTETLTGFLWAAAVLLLTIGFEKRRARAFAMAGIILGAAALVRPTGQAFAAFLLVALLWAYGYRDRRWLWHALAFVVAFAAVISPWAIRNYRIFHRPVGLSSFGGLNFWSGNYLPFHGRFRQASYPIVHRITAGSRDEMQADRALWREGWRNIGYYVSHRPVDYAGLLWDKFHTFWSSYSGQALIVGWRQRGLHGWHLHNALLLLGLVGFLAATLSARRYAAVFAVVAFVSLVHVATIAEEGRYNILVMPYVMILAVRALEWLLPGLFRSTQSSVAHHPSS
ncbi:MAG: glycosyltransferase family 39 protein [Armatimonadota bacterium]|nr:MAG: glycosyltransferase family 39 protein [Armatimonadota bacterium]